MKHELANIYRELAAGKLSRQEALARIRALKEPLATQPRTRLTAPVWRAADAPARNRNAGIMYAQHRVLLCGVPVADLRSHLKQTRCKLLPLDESASLAQNYSRIALTLFEAIRALFEEKPEGPSLVQLVVGESDHADIFAGLSGLLETAALENPHYVGQIVFVPRDITASRLAAHLEAEANDPRSRLVRYSDSGRQTRGWEFVEDSCAPGDSLFRENGVYLITGGLGGLGVLVAREVLERTIGARIILAGRGPLEGTRKARLNALQTSGRVTCRQADVTLPDDADQLVDSVLADYGRLDGIIHSAGVLHDDFILRKDSEHFSEVLGPKVAGTENLDRASRMARLDFFALFSSIASWAGNVGQADYAAANGFLEQFAGYRNALVAAGDRYGKTLAVAWPHWREGGMQVDTTSLAQLEKRTGLRSMKTDEGMAAFQACLALPQGHLMVMHGDPLEMRQALESERAIEAATPPVSVTTEQPAADDLVEKTREFLREEFSGILKVPRHRIETNAPLENYGIDSILAMNLTSQLEASFGTLSKTLFFEYQTIDELADYFMRSHADRLSRLVGTRDEVPSAMVTASPHKPIASPLPPERGHVGRRQRFLSRHARPKAEAATREPIAIVGLSGRYPASRDLEAFWRNLRDGKDCICEIPQSRWDWREYYSTDRTEEGVHFSKWGGFVEGADEFDPRFFKIAPREASAIDPQERLFLQHAWMALEDAGHTRADLQRPDAHGLAGQVGVYAGVMYGEYNLSGTLASIANRVSYFLNLHGPSLTLDTMCSSSLTAIHLACQDLRLGRTWLAIAGGVNLSIHPNKYTMLSGGQFISSRGHCESFGEGGDGYIPGEGVGVALLKRLSDAERDGNHIYGVIRGSALNHGGKTNGYTVPNPQAQTEVIRRAFSDAGVEPGHVSYIEAHGTGTKLGDPIEIAALASAFRGSEQAGPRGSGQCLIGSAKSNIGHCESAAGIAGLTKVLLQMKHRAVAPSLHSRSLNPHIDFDSTPFVVNQTLRPWEQPELQGRPLPRVAGISSFGAGGSNAHIVIEEYRRAEQPPVGSAEPVLVPLSARTPAQLEERARDLLAFIKHNGETLDLRAMAHTLQTGREAMDERLAFPASSVAEVASALEAFVKGGDAAAGIARGQVKEHREAVAQWTGDPTFEASLDQWVAERKLSKLAEWWVKGLDLDWRRLTVAGNPQRLTSLPTYPFARERYWKTPAGLSSTARAGSAPVLHPLVHTNVSNLHQQTYASTFTGAETFVVQEVAESRRLAPLLALEMVRVTAELAAGQPGESGLWELRHTRWGEPMEVDGERPIKLAVLPQDESVAVEIYTEADEEHDRIHCQSQANFSRRPAPARVDPRHARAGLQPARHHDDRISRLYLDETGAVADVHLPAEPERTDYLLHPQLLGLVAQLIGRVAGEQFVPEYLECLRIVFAPPEKALVWLRQAAPDVLDVDVCDQQGNVCLQMNGLQLTVAERVREAPAAAGLPTPIQQPDSSPLAPEPREMPLARPARSGPSQPLARGPVLSKPVGVRLQSASEIPTGGPLTPKPSVALAPLAAADQGSAIRLLAWGGGVFSMELRSVPGQVGLAQFLAGLDQIRGEKSLKALILTAFDADQWSSREGCNALIEEGVLDVMVNFPCPTIAALPDGARGAGLLLAAVADFTVCNQDAHYGFTDSTSRLFPNRAEDRFFRERLGEALAENFLYYATLCDGRALQRKGWACRFVAPTEVGEEARRLATALASKSRQALELLKAHLNRNLAPLVADLEVTPALMAAVASEGEAGAIELRLDASEQSRDVEALLGEIDSAFAKITAGTDIYCAVLLTASLESLSLKDGDAVRLVVALRDQVRQCPVPVIAAFPSGATGIEWLLGLFCDHAVYAAQGHYAASALWTHPALASEIAVLCAQRLGSSLGHEVCLGQGRYSGTELQNRTGTLAVAASAEVVPLAMRVAASWAAWPRSTLAAWRGAQVTHRQGLIECLPTVAEGDIGAEASPGHTASEPMGVSSRVLTTTAYGDGVVLVEMHDREARNMFSDALVEDLKETFARIERTPGCKVVVLTGYDNYFATGGTVDTLLAIQEGRAQFTDEKVFQLPMDCSLPVVAAIQGHGIGGGWSFGMFSDLILLSEESRYLSPYMDYGFTPGAGSTLVFPGRIGYDLARETLLTAQEVSGRQLRQRGLGLPVLPRAEVLPAALDTARRLARQSREWLVEAKKLWTHTLRQSRERTYRRELEMHDQTFVRNDETLAKIQASFSGEPVQDPVAAASANGRDAGAVVEKLRAMLAHELFLEPQEIGDDTPFIDLGLDSITGVTWIRKINEHYGADIEATKVYSQPTLRQLSQLVVDQMEAPAAAPAPVDETAGSPPASPTGDELQGVVSRLRELLAAELHLEPEEVEENQPFIDMGLDSITGVTWVRKINEHYGTCIEATQVYSHPTLREIAGLVQQEMASAVAQTAKQTPKAPASDLAVPSPAHPSLISLRVQRRSRPRKMQADVTAQTQPIAVIGIAGQFPKSRNLNEFWANLAAGKNCVEEVADGRWNLADYFQPGAPAPGKTNSKWLGALEDFDRFDPLFFNISPTEAESMDPQQRVFLQNCWHSIENAGYAPQALSGSQCGVFVGCGPSDYHQLSSEHRLSAQGFTGAATSILAARVAYLLNLRGPCVSIDTACSSSLVAMANACDSLNAGNSDLALAGGVYVMAGPSMHIMTAQAGMLSPDGRCFSFDQRANGFVPGEGVGVLMLKRLADAERDGDRIQAVIEGWGINQDGRSNGITAPNEESQTRLLQSVYRRFDIDAGKIQLVEAHGTGTKLGDPIEVAGLKAAFEPYATSSGYCALGSAKSNIGHCLTAAGAAGILKLVLALKHRALPPTANFRRGNEHIRLDGSPFYVNTRLQSWDVPNGERRRAAVSSFGFSGTNAHLVVAEPESQASRSAVTALTEEGRLIVPLSARTDVQLRQKARDLSSYLRGERESPDLLDVAYTLQVGRDHMEARLGLVVSDLSELVDKLDDFAEGTTTIPDAFTGQVKDHLGEMKVFSDDPDLRATVVAKYLAQRKLSKLLNLWVKGLDLDWTLLYDGESRPHRIELPGYPFARERYWIGAAGADGDALPTGALHPLLHANVSVLNRQRYSASFRGGDRVVDNRLNGVPILPAMALLEMARAAVEQATGDLEQPAVIELADLRWTRPLLIRGETTVTIDLHANDDDTILFEIHAGTSDVPVLTGLASLTEPVEPGTRDLRALWDRHAAGETGAAVYEVLRGRGLAAGPVFRAIDLVHPDPEGAWVRISFPETAEAVLRGCVLPPSLVEATVQAATFLAGDENAEPLQPVTMNSLRILAPCEKEMVARLHRDTASAARHQAFRVELLNSQGTCCLVMDGLTLAPMAPGETTEEQPELVAAAPVWDVIDASQTPAVQRSRQVVIIGAEAKQQDLLREHFREAALTFIDIAVEDGPHGIAGKLDGVDIDQLVWVASTKTAVTPAGDDIIEDQERGILQVLRISRSLAQLGYAERDLIWDLITFSTIPVSPGDSTDPTHAGLQGFVGSMAEVYPRWKIRLLDLENLAGTRPGDLDKPPFAANGPCYALRAGEWYRQRLLAVRQLAEGPSPYRHGGVYVVVGGSGGLGEIWSRHLIRNYGARIVWIGRRPLDADIAQKLDSLEACGERPTYIQADASSRDQLAAARARILETHPTIHGVVHTAVGAFDQSLKTVSEDDFRSILSVKIDLSVRIAQVFAADDLDLMLFFSSNASFVRGGGMSGYAAGNCFKDAFARALDQRLTCLVKVVNWGYWSVGAGDALTDSMKAYFHQSGYRPLQEQEGMMALDRFMASDFQQLSITKRLPSAAAALEERGEWMTNYGPMASTSAVRPMLDRVQELPLPDKFGHVSSKPGAAMEPLLLRLLQAIVRDVPAVLPAYQRWLAESKRIVDINFDGSDTGTPLGQLWDEWAAAMRGWREDAGSRALCNLVDRCVRALPEILTGRQKATDVIFPGSSLELVEEVYKTDTISLAYNEALRDTLIATVRARLEAEPDAQIRLLEIGAGTGATTVGILEQLKPYERAIAEYCYTDLSKAFLFHAEKHYAPQAPYLRTRIFDCERPLAEQGIDPNRYDFVIAANVIHATSNIRKVLRNAKAVLRRDGALLMNEISDKSICGHLTFGLLEGWWLNEDDEIRIPGSPGLYPASWQAVLEAEGFHSVVFPCRGAHSFGQQIVLAFSDGVVRQLQETSSVEEPLLPPPADGAVSQTAATPVVMPSGPLPEADETQLRGKAVDFCKRIIGSALKLNPDQIDAGEHLERYGIDSIVVGLVNQELQAHLGDVGSTLLYEHQTIAALADHLLETQRERLGRVLGVPAAGSAAAPPRLGFASKTPPVTRTEAGPSLRQKTLDFCKQLIGKALKIGPEQIDTGERLERYGIDSIVVGLVNQELQSHFGDIDSTLLFEHQTVEALAGHLLSTQRAALERLLGPEQGPVTTAARAGTFVNGGTTTRGARLRLGVKARQEPVSRLGGSRARQPIAIIGLSGQYAQADNLEAFWTNLKTGRDCVTEIPGDRWPLEGFFEPDESLAVEQGKSYCKWGSFLEGFAEFDPLFFGIPPREALNMDPQERLFMQAAWAALENAGYTRRALKDQFDGRVGIFAGITRAGYNLYRTTLPSEEKFWPRTSFSSVANRLSYFLDVHGPSLPVDTMCSSSLTAIHEACEHIHNGDCDLALSGGVNLYLHPTSFIDMSSQHMLSPDGCCKSFGKGGNGFVPGEGVGVLVLKPLDRAEADGDLIHGVILATQVNHGGRTNGFTVPNPVAQAALVRGAIDKAGISAGDISYIEAHGTGTELGDPIEIAGLRQAFAPDTQETGYCRIGSAKSNIGHLEAAAGIAGVTKVLLQMKHRQLVPSLHASSINPHIKFERTPFEVNQTLAPWRPPTVEGQAKPRIAGVSSFGAGGANAHIILQEYQPDHAQAARDPLREPGPVAVPLSAKTPEQLQQRAEDLLGFLRRPHASLDLDSLAYTLQVGREDMEFRAGFVVDSVEQLVESLNLFISGGEDAHLYRGQVRDGKRDPAPEMGDRNSTLEEYVPRQQYPRLAELWVQGTDIDWRRLYPGKPPARMELPTYPFARETYWIDSIAGARLAPAIHPPVDSTGTDRELAGLEEIIAGIDDTSIDADEGVELLKQLL